VTTTSDLREVERILAETVTGLWRLSQRLDDEAAARRQLERTLDALTDAGIRIDDHRGDAFDPGLPIEVVAYQATAGLDRETVIGLERPSVYRNGSVIQRARVIVGTPERGGSGDDGQA
jgi:murein L,D-transpeptidase YcbB/YkuD